MRTTQILILAAVFLLVGSTLAQATHTPRHRWDSMPEAARTKALQRAEQHGMFAKMDMDAGGNVTGRFVSFHYAKDIGTIHDFTVKHGTQSALLFDAITPTPFTLSEQPSVSGNVFRSPTNGLGVAVHNNPVALSHWSVPANATQSVTLTFDVAAGVNRTNNNGHSARLDKGTGHVHLVSKGNVTLTNSSSGISATIPPGERLMLMAHPPSGHMAAFLHTLNSLYEKGLLGGVHWMVGVDGTPAVDGFQTDANVTVKAIRRGHVTIGADAAVTGPRVFVFVVDPETLNPQRADKIKAKINGAAVGEAASEEDVAAGTQAKVRVVRGQDVAVVFVMVPHFSTQTIVLEEEGATGTTTPFSDTFGDGASGQTTGTPGPDLAALGVAVAIAGLVLGRRRWNA